MTSHIHLIIGTHGNNMEDIIRDIKRHTAEKLRSALTVNSKESRKEWMLWMMQRTGQKNSNNIDFRFWQIRTAQLRYEYAARISRSVYLHHRGQIILPRKELWLKFV